MDELTHEDIVSNLKEAIKEEISYKKSSSKSKGKGTILKDGQRKIVGASIFYKFRLDKPVKLPKDVRGYIFAAGTKFEGAIADLSDDHLVWNMSNDLGESIKQCNIVVEETDLLNAMIAKLEEIESGKLYHNKRLADKIFGLSPIKLEVVPNCSRYLRVPQNLNSEQDLSLNMAAGSEVLFIWGPPGTGKSKTLSSQVDTFYRSGKKVLVLSHTHAAVDSLLKKALQFFTPAETDNGVIMRYGSTNEKTLECILPEIIIEKRTKELQDRLNQVIKEYETVTNSVKSLKSCLPLIKEIERLGQEKGKHIELLNEKEKELQSFQIEKNKAQDRTNDIQLFLDDVQSKPGLVRWIYSIKRDCYIRELKNLEVKVSQFEDKLNNTQANIETRKSEVSCIDVCINRTMVSLRENGLIGLKPYQIVGKIQVLNRKAEELKKIADGLISEIKQVEITIWGKNKILGATLTAAVLNSSILKNYWDVVIIDELSTAPAYSVLIAAGLARKSVVLCGDFYQLSPIAEGNTEQVNTWLKRSVFDIRGITQKIESGTEVPELVMLKYQYRCHPEIAKSISELVYNGFLLNGLPGGHSNFSAAAEAPFTGNALVLIDISKAGFKSIPPGPGKRSLINNGSANIIVKLLSTMTEEREIGIISPFNGQCNLIQEMIKDLDTSRITISTVHRYQGSEKDIIIFDLVESGMNWVSKLTQGAHGTEAMRLINVAATRAKGKLIVIADVSFYKRKLNDQDITKMWLEYIYGHGKVINWKEVCRITG